MKDQIHLCDVVLYDGKLRREYRLKDVVLAGNDKKLIWNCKIHRERLITYAFKTPAKIKKQRDNFHLYIKSIDFKVYVGDSNHNWGLTK